MEIEILRAEPYDADGIACLEEMCFNHPWTKDDILSSFGSSTVFFVAKCGEKAVGYLGMQVTLDGGFITNVAVHSNFRRMGVASRLIDSIINFCESSNIKTVSLEVRVSNTPAYSLYSKKGFERIGVRKNFYRDPKEDAIIMTKQV